MEPKDRLKSALTKLFGSAEIGFGFLHVPRVGADRPSDAELALPAQARAQLLEDRLLGYVCAMADELDELGKEDSPRIQAETRALLIAVRELRCLFPHLKE